MTASMILALGSAQAMRAWLEAEASASVLARASWRSGVGLH
jgi:hypothetical protein